MQHVAEFGAKNLRTHPVQQQQNPKRKEIGYDKAKKMFFFLSWA